MFIKQARFIVLLCLLAFSITLAVRQPIKFKTCEDGKLVGKLLSVDISPCPTGPTKPCVFHKGTSVTATIKFSPSVTVTNGTLEIYGIIGRIKEKFPFPQSDACKGHNLECPLKAGQEYSLIMTLAVQKRFPSMKLVAQMDFKLSENKYVLCFQFPIQIE